MLRITTIVNHQSVMLKLEGSLLAAWTDEVRLACAKALEINSNTFLDLTNVTFVDAAGTQLLGELKRQGIRIAASSPFVSQLLHSEEL